MFVFQWFQAFVGLPQFCSLLQAPPTGSGHLEASPIFGQFLAIPQIQKPFDPKSSDGVPLHSGRPKPKTQKPFDPKSSDKVLPHAVGPSNFHFNSKHFDPKCRELRDPSFVLTGLGFLLQQHTARNAANYDFFRSAGSPYTISQARSPKIFQGLFRLFARCL